MRCIKLDRPTPCLQDQRSRLARLTRHLQARLLDFGPGGPQVCSADQEQGRVEVQFPGHDAGEVCTALAKRGIHVAQEGAQAVFFLAPDTRFEDLDHLWGCLFELLA